MVPRRPRRVSCRRDGRAVSAPIVPWLPILLLAIGVAGGPPAVAAGADEAPPPAARGATPPAASTRPAHQGPLQVGTARGTPGHAVRGVLQVGEEVDGTPISLPLVIVTGSDDGPVVWIQALAHGDEFGGARALQEVVADLDPDTLRGTVVAVLAANPPAFRALQRVDPNFDDRLDLGESFPGNPNGFLTERIAAALRKAVQGSADYFLDLHTGGDRFVELPFILYSLDAAIPTERYDDLARGFGIPHLWRDATHIFPTDAMATFNASGIPSFLVEVGGGQPIDPAHVRLQADAVRSFLRKVGALPGRPAAAKTYTVISGYQPVTNTRGGFFSAVVKPGDRIKEGDVLGTISDLYGDPVETIRAPAGAQIVLGVITYPAWPTGGWLLEVGSGLLESPGAPAPERR
jgi:uncharacterized protein